ncbi:MAG TPA: hypothetical protein VK459_19345, partial [Polyangiaceae bacterium]|nr:hypothetical protein [Polyangiaceae bacterium]
EGQWRVKGLPQHGFPYALAVTDLRPDASRPDVRVRILAVDPRTVSASEGGSAPQGGKTVAILGAGEASASQGALSIWHSAGSFSIAAAAPVAGSTRLATGLAAAGAGASLSGAGIRDEDGMLLYVELSSGAGGVAGQEGALSGVPAALIDGLLKRLGCSTRVVFGRKLPIALGGDTDLAGAAVHPPGGPGAVRLTRTDAPAVRRIFEDTPIVPFKHWYSLQQHRIRYFKKPKGEAGDDEQK